MVPSSLHTTGHQEQLVVERSNGGWGERVLVSMWTEDPARGLLGLGKQPFL